MASILTFEILQSGNVILPEDGLGLDHISALTSCVKNENMVANQ